MAKAHRRTTSKKSPVVIFDYDPEWPNIYANERAKILYVIGPKIVAVEHIGSTAVPGLGAKPVIDIMVGIRDLSVAHECVKPLRRIGYEYIPEYEVSIPERRYFRKAIQMCLTSIFICTWLKRQTSSGVTTYCSATTCAVILTKQLSI